MCYCNPHRLKMVDIIAGQLKKKRFQKLCQEPNCQHSQRQKKLCQIAYGTEKGGHEFGTNSGQYSLGLAEMVMGDIINDSYDSFLDMINNTNVF